MAPAVQYQQPTAQSQVLIESYVRHIADEYATRGGPNNPIRSIKVYYFRHNNMWPWEIAAEGDPLSPVCFQGYYEGEYDPDGKLLHPDILDQQGNLVERPDPFLYWYVPIYLTGQDDHGNPFVTTMQNPAKGYKLVDSLTEHAHIDLDRDPDKQIKDPSDSPWNPPAEKRQ